MRQLVYTVFHTRDQVQFSYGESNPKTFPKTLLISKIFWKALKSQSHDKNIFYLEIFRNSFFHISIKHLKKDLKLWKVIRILKFEEILVNYAEEFVSTDNHEQNIWQKRKKTCKNWLDQN